MVSEMKERILDMLDELNIDISIDKFNEITDKNFICMDFLEWTKNLT